MRPGGLRESLAAWLGVETDEIGIATGASLGADQSKRVSAYLFDRAAGGAGLSLRLGEEGRLGALIFDTIDRLSCPEHCAQGCPACILRPDMNMSQVLPDRLAGLSLAKALRDLLALDARKQAFGPGTVATGLPLFDLISQRIGQGAALSVTLFARGRPDSWSLPDWPALAALAGWRQKVPVEIVFATESLQDPAMDVPTRLNLMRIAGEQGLAHRADLPQGRLMPVLAAIQTAQGLIGVAAAAQVEARPDAAWGAGVADILVTGPMDSLPDWQHMPIAALMPKADPGKSAYVLMGNRLDVRLSQFGKAFWSVIAKEAPDLHARLIREGVAELRYDDRYLLQPLHFKLLREIALAVPGQTAPVLRLYTMNKPPSDRPMQIDQPLACDEDRESLFDELFPGDRLSIRPKAETEHPRFLTLTTAAGSRVMVYFDQGMDLWRVAQKVPTPHGGNMARLAQQLESIDPPMQARMAHRPTLFVCLI